MFHHHQRQPPPLRRHCVATTHTLAIGRPLWRLAPKRLQQLTHTAQESPLLASSHCVHQTTTVCAKVWRQKTAQVNSTWQFMIQLLYICYTQPHSYDGHNAMQLPPQHLGQLLCCWVRAQGVRTHTAGTLCRWVWLTAETAPCLDPTQQTCRQDASTAGAVSAVTASNINMRYAGRYLRYCTTA